MVRFWPQYSAKYLTITGYQGSGIGDSLSNFLELQKYRTSDSQIVFTPEDINRTPMKHKSSKKIYYNRLLKKT
jgi:hypothetical protein